MLDIVILIINHLHCKGATMITVFRNWLIRTYYKVFFIEKRKPPSPVGGVDLLKLQTYVGKPVIYVSDMDRPPVVGFAEKIEFIPNTNTHVLVVCDYISKDTVKVSGKIWHYTDDLFHAVFTIDSDTMLALMRDHQCEVVADRRDYRTRRYSQGQALSMLELSGFIDRLRTWRESSEHGNPNVLS